MAEDEVVVAAVLGPAPLLLENGERTRAPAQLTPPPDELSDELQRVCPARNG